MTLQLRKFEPATFIELTDTVKGFRKLGLVTDSGDMYLDLAEEGSTPFPIYAELNPISVGNTLSWSLQLADKDPKKQGKYAALHAQLVENKIDTITAARALRWSVQNDDFAYLTALGAGRAATDAVRGSRAMIDKIVARGATA